MVPSPPFVAIPSFSRRAHWLSCYAHGGFSCPWMWRSGEVDHIKKRGNRRFLDGRRCCLRRSKSRKIKVGRAAQLPLKGAHI